MRYAGVSGVTSSITTDEQVPWNGGCYFPEDFPFLLD